MFPSPSLEPPTLSNFQWQFGGLTFGAGTPWGVLKVDGLGLADIRSGNAPWPRDHGEALGLDLFGGRTIVIDLWDVSGGTSLQARQLELASATNILPGSEQPLWFQLPTFPLLCVMCRIRKRPTTIDSDYAAAQVAKPELVFAASDPRIYTAATATAFAPNHPSTSVVLNNTGNTEMRPVVVFSGPLSYPFIKNKTIAGEPKLEVINPAARKAREAEELAKRVIWEKEQKESKITKKEREEKEAALKAELVAEEKEDAEKGEEPTVKEGDQILLNLGPVHLAQYWTGGVGVGSPVNVSGWIAPGSVWWDLLPGNNTVQFGSIDNKNTGGTATTSWASAYQL